MTAKKKAAKKKVAEPEPVEGVLVRTRIFLAVSGEPVVHCEWGIDFPPTGPFFSARLTGAFAVDAEKYAKMGDQMQRIEAYRGAHHQWLALANALIQVVEESKKSLYTAKDGNGTVQ